MKSVLILGILSSLGDSISLSFPLIAGTIALLLLLLAFSYRTIVPTNMVHIVQSRKQTTSYGTGQDAGNVYYRWPSWLPYIGVSNIPLPVSNFNLSFESYDAYDKDRVPFVLDLTAFFRIADTNKAAERVSSIEELKVQLDSILKGAARKILASHDINAIMTDRATFGSQFTEEVRGELENWGVETVKSIELMDIRDAHGSTVIADIMAKKSSQINMESRIEVAKNKQEAEIAEIEATQKISVRQQEADELIGKRTAEKDKTIGIAEQQAKQEIKAEEVKTAEKQMEVKKIETVRQAEITKEAAIVSANQKKETVAIEAQGALEATKFNAEGIQKTGEAEAEALKAKQMAPVNAQIALAKEIGQNPEYQNYLVLLEFVKAYTSVGSEQAKAMQSADIKIIANGGTAQAGVNNALELFSANGGMAIGSMLEALKSMPQGQQLFEGIQAMLSGNAKSTSDDQKKQESNNGEETQS